MMNVGCMKLPSQNSPKSSSMSFPLPMVSSTSISFDRQKARISSSVLPSQSKPVFSLIASRMGRRRYGALKLMTLPSISASGLPLTAMQMRSRSCSVNDIIHL